MTCKRCNGPAPRSTTTGLCGPCYHATRKREPRTCSDCSGPISRSSKGRCRKCTFEHMIASEGFEERRVAAIRKRFEDPKVRARAAWDIHERHMKARQDPAIRRKFRQNLKKARSRLKDADVVERWLAGRDEAGKKRHETVMSWCPKEYRAEYVRLVRTKRLLAADARRIVEETIKRDWERMTPFERAMKRVQQGAGIHARPDLSDKRGPDFSLGGVTPT